ncbi:hypothetical protein [Dyadobacter tibetensis]|uniref:hypothetical protein n=1 Tax=Dyadobacter tibetensis TaxID=1211851 RepID=UPI000470DBFC|nr:hypothetical protein [Dyadobacter tibetensis]
MKNILTVSYSQSGQMNQILHQFMSGFPTAQYQIEHFQITPKDDFPFPWTAEKFFDLMPSCVQEDRIELEPYTYERDRYDLIVIAYQPWFLSPSLPITALLKSEKFQRLLRETPVVTLIAGRNMWLNAQERVKLHILEAGGKLIANIPLMDRTPNLISAITILHWMLTGRKDRKWNIFPKPGVADEDILKAGTYGAMVSLSLSQERVEGLQDQLVATGAFKIPTDILFIEERAKKLFKIWARLITERGTTPLKRRRWVRAYKYYLVVALFIVAPILVSLYQIMVAPLSRNAINRRKKYFNSIEIKL